MRHFLSVLALVALAPCVGAAPKPNVIFVLADDQRFDTIAALGNAEIKTPKIGRAHV